MSVVEQEEPTPPPSVPLHRRLPGGRTFRDGRRLYWWGEIIAVLAFYGVYTFIRNLHHGNPQEAYDHTLDIIRWQKTLGINNEQAVQAWALGSRFFIIAANYFYGSLHFIVTGGVMIYLYRKWSDDYPRWRNTLGIATGLALIGFAFFPLMPPRLLTRRLRVHPPQLRLRDTLAKDPAFWSFNSGAVSKISNQFAAMPSVHCAWALWCACVLVPRVKHVWAKVLAVIYPITTVTVIVVTANHYFLDAVGGFFVFGVGYVDRAHLHPRRPGPGGRHRGQPPQRPRAGQSFDRFARCPRTRKPIAAPNSAEIRDHQDHRRRPRVEHEVDAHLVGVEQREQHQDRGQRPEQDQLDVDLATVVVARLCCHRFPRGHVRFVRDRTCFFGCFLGFSRVSMCFSTSRRTLSRTARSASDICTSRADDRSRAGAAAGRRS